MEEKEYLDQELNKAREDCENMAHEKIRLESDNDWMYTELRVKENEISNLKNEISHLNKIREGLNRKLRQMDDQKGEVESLREDLRKEIELLQKGRFIAILSSVAMWQVFNFPCRNCVAEKEIGAGQKSIQ